MSASVLDLPRLNEHPTITTNCEPTSITPDNQTVFFSQEEMASLHHDDAMASAVIVIVLCFAFLVLFCLAIVVNVWMTYFAV